MKVLAALSGGVDSAVAAARAVDAGHDVTGVHLALAKVPDGGAGSRGCCTPEDARDARRVADVLGIPFYVWDLAERFQVDVVDDFLAEYAAGRTPNPCLRCNERIKFAAVLDRARALGFDAVCTGHHARLVDGADGTRSLHRSVDVGKDQSYVLAVLDAEQLAGAMFPLGDSTKAQVRAEAAARGLGVADKPDSHDVCFIPTGTAAQWVRARVPVAPGDVVDQAGSVVGRHDGTAGLTVGQRRGLHLDRPAPDGQARYVLSIEPVAARVVVGPADALDVRALRAVRPRWAGDAPRGSFACAAQVRAHGATTDTTVEVAGDELLVRFVEPVRGVAPGQAVALYDGDRVIGSATISLTEPEGDAQLS